MKPWEQFASATEEAEGPDGPWTEFQRAKEEPESAKEPTPVGEPNYSVSEVARLAAAQNIAPSATFLGTTGAVGSALMPAAAAVPGPAKIPATIAAVLASIAAGGYISAKTRDAQNAALEKWQPGITEELSRARSQHERAAMASEWLTSGFKPSLSLAGGALQQFKERAIPAGLGAVTQAYAEIQANKGKPGLMGEGGWGRVAESAGMMALFNKTNKAGQMAEKLGASAVAPIVAKPPSLAEKVNVKANTMEQANAQANETALSGFNEVNKPADPAQLAEFEQLRKQQEAEMAGQQTAIENQADLELQIQKADVAKQAAEKLPEVSGGEVGSKDVPAQVPGKIEPPKIETPNIDRAGDTVLAEKLAAEPPANPKLAGMIGQRVRYAGKVGQLARDNEGNIGIYVDVRKAGEPLQFVEIEGSGKDLQKRIKDVGVEKLGAKASQMLPGAADPFLGALAGNVAARLTGQDEETIDEWTKKGLMAGMGAPGLIRRGRSLSKTGASPFGDRQLVTKTEREMRINPTPFGLKPNSQGKIPSQDIKIALSKQNNLEQELMQQAGIDQFLANKPTVSPAELADFIEQNGPRVEVHDYGMEGKANPKKLELDKLIHEFETKVPRNRRDMAAEAAVYMRSLIEEGLPDAEVKTKLATFLDKNKISEEDFATAYKIGTLSEDVAAGFIQDSGPRATDYYHQISPKDVIDNPMQRVDVVIPNPESFGGYSVKEDQPGKWRILRSDGSLAEDGNYYEDKQSALRAMVDFSGDPTKWRADMLHENLPNTLGWAAIQYHDVPGVGKVAHIFEAQSRWAQTRRNIINRFEKEFPKDNTTIVRKGIEVFVKGSGMSESRRYTPARFMEKFGFLPEEGTSRPVTASEWNSLRDNFNAKQTPDDPLLHDYNRLILKAAIQKARENGATHIAISDAETAMMTEGHDMEATRLRTLENPERTRRVEVDMGTQRATDLYNQGWKTVSARTNIGQEEGMRLNYDQRLPKIAEELTGDKGKPINLGAHKNALDQSDAFGILHHPEPESGNPYRVEDRRTGEFKDFDSYEKAHDYASGLRNPRKDLIFKNPDGTPKTDVTGRVYSIQGKEGKELGRPFTLSDKRGAVSTELGGLAAYHGAAGLVGAGVGYATGDTPEDRKRRAILGFAMGAGGTAALRAAKGPLEARLAKQGSLVSPEPQKPVKPTGKALPGILETDQTLRTTKPDAIPIKSAGEAPVGAAPGDSQAVGETLRTAEKPAGAQETAAQEARVSTTTDKTVNAGIGDNPKPWEPFLSKNPVFHLLKKVGTVTDNVFAVLPEAAGRIRDMMKRQADIFIESEDKIMPGLKAARKLLGNSEFEAIGRRLMSGEEAQVLAELKAAGREDVIEGLMGWIRERDQIFASHQNARPDEKFGYVENYWPRRIVDAEGLKKAIGSKDPSVMQQALNDALAAKRKRTGDKMAELTPEEEGDALTSLLSQSLHFRGKPGYLQRRTLETIEAKWDKFFEPIDVSIEDQLQRVARDVAEQEFLGKVDRSAKNPWIEPDFESAGAIGEVVAKAIKEKRLGEEGQAVIRENINALIGRPYGDSASYRISRALGAIQTASNLNQLGNGIRQLTDAFMVAFRTDPESAAKGFAKALFKAKDRVSMEHISLHEGNPDVMEFSRNRGALDKLVNQQLLISFFKFFDQLGKEGLLTADKEYFTKIARKHVPGEVEPLQYRFARERHEKMYGSESWDQLVDKMKEQDWISPEAKKFLFNRISDAQPTTRAEMALGKLQAGPLGQIPWRLMSFTIRQMGMIRTNVYEQIRAGNYGDASRWMAQYAFWMLVGNSVVQYAIDMVNGTDHGNIEDYTVGAILQMVGLNKYAVTAPMTGKMTEVIGQRVIPGLTSLPGAAKHDVELVRDWMQGRRWAGGERAGRKVVTGLVSEEDFDLSRARPSKSGSLLSQSELVKYFPAVGKMYYGYKGAGAATQERKSKMSEAQKNKTSPILSVAEFVHPSKPKSPPK